MILLLKDSIKDFTLLGYDSPAIGVSLLFAFFCGMVLLPLLKLKEDAYFALRIREENRHSSMKKAYELIDDMAKFE